jgi:hypothetical protein
MALNAGHFSRARYDKNTYQENLYDSTAPYSYTMNSDRIHNCGGCLTTFGPRGGFLGAGVSSPTGDVIAAGQNNIDVDSITSNRNVSLSKCKRGKVNPVNITNIKTKHIQECNDYLDSQHSRMTDPAMFYRGAPINRFYDLDRDPQANIYYDWGINTGLEMRDNYDPSIPIPLDNDMTLPKNNKDYRQIPCAIALRSDSVCDAECQKNCDRKMRITRNYKNNTLNNVQYQQKPVSQPPR